MSACWPLSAMNRRAEQRSKKSACLNTTDGVLSDSAVPTLESSLISMVRASEVTHLSEGLADLGCARGTFDLLERCESM